MRRIPKWALWLFVIVSCLAGFVFVVTMDEVLDATADASRGGSRVWIHTPFVGPSDRAWLSVETDGRVREVEVTTPDGVSVGRWDGETTDYVYVPIAMPDRLGTVELVANARWGPKGRTYGLWRDSGRSDAVRFTIESRSSLQKWLRRLGMLLLALAFWLQSAFGMSKLAALGDSETGDNDLDEALGGAICVVLVFYVVLGYWAFVLPLYAATHWVGLVPAILWLLVWIAGAPYAGWRFHKWVEAQRNHQLRPYRAVSASDLKRALADAAIEIRTWPGWAVLTHENERLLISTRDLAQGRLVRIWGGSEPLALRVALALGREASVSIETYGFWVDVGPGATLEGLQEELNERRLEAAKEMMKVLEDMGEMMERMKNQLNL